MNTIVRIPLTGKSVINPHLGSTAVKAKDESELALIVQPGSLHASGEIYHYSDGLLRALHVCREGWVPGGNPTLLTSKEVDGEWLFVYYHNDDHELDIILPRRELDELHRLASPLVELYLIRVPAIGLGSVSVVLTEDMVPLLVPTRKPLERARGLTKQKHVSKSHTVKQRRS